MKSRVRRFRFSLVLCASIAVLAFGDIDAARGVQVRHVFIVVEENQNFSDVIGNPAMPYLNGLATSYAYSTGYYANTHPSMPNYFMLTAGKLLSTGQTVTDDNIVRHLLAAGKTWKEYSEGLPYAGYRSNCSGCDRFHQRQLAKGTRCRLPVESSTSTPGWR